MKKSNSILSLMLVLCMAVSLFTVPVHADVCCSIGIDRVEQDSEKVTVYWNAKVGSEERLAEVGIYRANDSTGTKVTGQYYTITNTDIADFVTEFDISTFLKDEA